MLQWLVVITVTMSVYKGRRVEKFEVSQSLTYYTSLSYLALKILTAETSTKREFAMEKYELQILGPPIFS